MKKSPIFHMLELVDRGRVSDIDLSFKDSLALNSTAEKGKDYYLINLVIKRPDLKINGVPYTIRQSHMSVFKHYRDNHFGLTAYHYTAELCDIERNRFTLHAYYDNFGNYRHCQLKNSQQKEITITDDATIIALSGQHILPLISEVNRKIDEKYQSLSEEVRTIQFSAEDLSKTLFGGGLRKEQLQPVYQKYTVLMKKYVGIVSQCNNCSFNPDLSLENFLENTFSKLKSREIFENLLERFQPKKKKQNKARAGHKGNTVKFEISHNSTSVNKVDLTKLNNLRGELLGLRKLDTAKALLRRCFVIDTLLKQLPDDAYLELLDLIIERNSLTLLAQNKIEELAGGDKVKDIRKLYNIAGDVSGKAIICAVKSNALNTLDFLLEKYKRNIDIYMKGKFLLSLSNLKHATVARLLRKGANPNVVDFFGESPLTYAAQSGDVQRLQLLLDFKADVNYQRVKPPSLVVIEKCPSGLKLQKALQNILDKEDDFLTPLHLAIQARCLLSVKLLIESGADQTLIGKKGFSPIMHCSALNKSEEPLNDAGRAIMHYLFTQVGCDINQMGGQPGLRATMLHFSLQYARYDCTVELLKLGADPNILREHAQLPVQRITALAYCAWKGQREVVALFLEHEDVKLSIKTLAKAMLVSSDRAIINALCNFMLHRFIDETLVADPGVINNRYGTYDQALTMLDFAVLFNMHHHAARLRELGAKQALADFLPAGITIEFQGKK